MKRLNDISALCLGTIMLCSCSVTQAQNGNAIDRVIEKWKDNDGIKTTYVQKKVKNGKDVYIRLAGDNRQFTREAQAAVDAEKDNCDRVRQNKRHKKLISGQTSELTVLETTTKTNPPQRITYVWEVTEEEASLSSHIRPRSTSQTFYIDGALEMDLSGLGKLKNIAGLEKLKDIDWSADSIRIFDQNGMKVSDIRRYSLRLNAYQNKYRQYLRRYKDLEASGKLDEDFIRRFRDYEQRFKRYQNVYLKRIKAYEKMLRQSKSQLSDLDQELERADNALNEADTPR